MTDLEELLSDRFTEQAQQSEVTMTVEDICLPSPNSEIQSNERSPLLLVAAALVLIGLCWGWLQTDARSVEVDAANPAAQYSDQPELWVIGPEGRRLSLDRVETSASLLDTGATVLEGEEIGRVEVGVLTPQSFPTNRPDATWYRGAHCVATEVLTTCFNVNNPGIYPISFADHSGTGWVSRIGWPTDPTIRDAIVDKPLVTFTQPSKDGLILISDLSPKIAIIKILTNEPLTQVPIDRTVAFPLRSDSIPVTDLITVWGFDGEGTLNLVLSLDVSSKRNSPPDYSDTGNS